MANDTTLLDLRTRALDYADMTSSAFPVTARVNDYINIELAHLHDILVNSHDDYFRLITTIALSSGQELYDLPSDFYKAMKLYYISSSRRYKVLRFNPDQIDGYRSDVVRAGGSVELWYVPQYSKLINDSDVVSYAIAPGWDDYVAMGAAVRLLGREESDTSFFERKMAEWKDRITDVAEPRDEGEANVVGDHYGRFGTGQIFRVEERFLRYRIMGNKIHFVEFEYLGA